MSNTPDVEMSRDFIGYGSRPPRVEWPGGARLAVNFAINYEEGAEFSPGEGDPQREMLSEVMFPAPPEERELASESIFEYGSRAGIWRLLRLFDKYEVPCSVFACGRALERNPAVTQAFLERGYDMVGHGYRSMAHYGLSEDQERAHIRAGKQSIEQLTGQPVLGWFSRLMTTSRTRRILAEEGLLYDSCAFNDDLPYFQTIGERRLLIVPYSLDVNDVRYVRNQLFTSDDFFHYARDTFDTLYAEGADCPRMMSVGLHARTFPASGRTPGLDRFLAHVRQFKDVWLANRNDIARFWVERYG